MRSPRNIPKLTLYVIAAFLIGILFGTGVRPALAHPMPDSRVLLDINRDSVDMALHVPLVELEVAYAKPLSKNPNASIARYHDDLEAYFARHIAVLSPDGRVWHVSVDGVKRGEDQTPPFWTLPTAFVDEDRHLTPPPGRSVRKCSRDYDVVVHQLLTHVALFSVRRDWNNGVFSDSPVVLGELRVFKKSFDIDIPSGSAWQGFVSIVRLGIRHIAEGTDHLLFLLALLLPAALGVRAGKWDEPVGMKASLWRLLKIVSAFTVGHSLTLVAGALGWMRPPQQPIEVLIALSIFVSALHAIRPIFPGREAYIAAGFGLIHGLSFAAVVADFGLDPLHTALSIVGFNLGIELMQLFVVAVTVPWLLLLARTPLYTPFRVAGGFIAAVAALTWMGERTFGWNNPVGAGVEKAASNAVWIVAVLAAVSIGAALWERRHRWIEQESLS